MTGSLSQVGKKSRKHKSKSKKSGKAGKKKSRPKSKSKSAKKELVQAGKKTVNTLETVTYNINKPFRERQPDSIDPSRDGKKIFKAMFDMNPNFYVSHHINSYNNFLTDTLTEIFQDLSGYIVTVDPSKLRQNQNNQSTTNNSQYSSFIHRIDFGEYQFEIPNLGGSSTNARDSSPITARQKSMTYASRLLVRARHTIVPIDRSGNMLEPIVIDYDDNELINLGQIPVMVNSKACTTSIAGSTFNHEQTLRMLGEDPYEGGGYFIIGGNERIITGQESRKDRHAYFYDNRTQDSNFSHGVEIKCKHRDYDNAKGVSLLYNKTTREIEVKIGANRYLKPDSYIPLMVLFKALGIETDEEITKMCIGDHVEYPEMVEIMRTCSQHKVQNIKTKETMYVNTHTDAIQYIASLAKEKLQFGNQQTVIDGVHNLLKQSLFPHIGVETNGVGDVKLRKAYFLGYMARRLLWGITGRIDPDSIDAIYNKRIETTGHLMSELVKAQLRIAMESIDDALNQVSAEKTVRDEDFKGRLADALKDKLTGPAKDAIGSGRWKVAKSNSVLTRVAVSKKMERRSTSDSKSSANRHAVISTGSNPGKQESIRLVDQPSFNYVDPTETPEGSNVGIQRNKALSSEFTISQNPLNVLTQIDHLMTDIETFHNEHDLSELSYWTYILVNGDLVGFTQTPNDLVKHVRKLRQINSIHRHTGIVRNFHENLITIQTDSGRMVSPYLVVGPDNRLLIKKRQIRQIVAGTLSWTDLLAQGFIEYIDSHELFINCTVAQTVASLDLVDPELKIYTHCLIHPSSIFGICSGTIPYANHNPGTRNLFQSAMVKQALTEYALNHRLRVDRQGHILTNIHTPLVRTFWEQFIHRVVPCGGQHMLVAVGCFTGYNIEDSTVVNRGAVDRGLGLSEYYKLYTSVAKPNEIFTKPNPNLTTGMSGSGNYAHLNRAGRVTKGTKLREGDVIIGKVTPLEKSADDLSLDGYEYRDQSEQCHERNAVVDLVVAAKNSNSQLVVKVKLYIVRRPIIGDKFSSRHGQKGTIGIIYEQTDMPYTEYGQPIEMMINAHAIPSRMTIGHVRESLEGTLAAFHGCFVDATPFNNTSVRDTQRRAIDAGFRPDGTMQLYNPHSGLPMLIRYLIGILFMQKLKHMVDDKWHARQRGSVQVLTHQPLEGRSRKGGLRFGEMEKDVMIAHGATLFLKERFYECSDGDFVYVCQTCSMTAVGNDKKSYYWCPNCEDRAKIYKVPMCYSHNLLMNESRQINAVMGLVLKPFDLTRGLQKTE